MQIESDQHEVTVRSRPRWKSILKWEIPRSKSILKWVGLYLLAQLISGFTVGFFKLPIHDSLLSAVILIGMIVFHRFNTKAQKSSDAPPIRRVSERVAKK